MLFRFTRVQALISSLALLLPLRPAYAGPFTDNLSRCLVRSTSDQDRTVLVRWIFAVLVLHPDVQGMAAQSDEQRESLNKNVAGIVERLMIESCRSETTEAVKNEGPGTLESAFQVLGQVAARQLFNDPKVASAVGAFTKYLDPKKFEQLGAEAK